MPGRLSPPLPHVTGVHPGSTPVRVSRQDVESETSAQHHRMIEAQPDRQATHSIRRSVPPPLQHLEVYDSIRAIWTSETK
jgi:hypothetical protein